jgi:hypothetical protein
MKHSPGSNYTAEKVLPYMRNLVLEVVGSVPGSNLKDRLARAAKILGLKNDKIQRWYYGKVREVLLHEALNIIVNSRADRLRRLAGLRQELSDLRQEIRETDEGLASLLPPEGLDNAVLDDAASVDTDCRRAIADSGLGVQQLG